MNTALALFTTLQIQKFVFWKLLFFAIFISIKGYGQQVCGLVLDEKNREPLIGASVYLPQTQQGTFTDNNGYFCLPFYGRAGIKLQVFYTGYKTAHITNITTDSLIMVYLSPGFSIDEVVVPGKSLINKSTGIVEMPVTLLKKLPTISGEPDLLKSLQLMPGVKMGDEGTSVFFVRGGTPDQNLTLLDDVPLYYVNHIGGFLSVFDVNTIKRATLYKGYFPPRYGGRLSSVLDIRLKDGDVKKTSREVMIGTLSSKIFIEGPIIEDKLSAMFSVRRCNLDLFMRPIYAMASNGKDVTSYTFYDLTSKITYKRNPRNKFGMMFYSGRDKLHFKEKDNAYYESILNNNWGNIAGSITWNHFSKSNWITFSEINFTKFYRVFKNREIIHSDDENYKSVGEFSSRIGDVTVLTNISRSFTNFHFKAGIEPTWHKFVPSAIKSKEENNTQNGDTLFINKLNQFEFKGYIETDWDVTPRLNISPGIFTMYWPQISQISFDPRISVSYYLQSQAYLKASYSANHQFIHLLSNNSGGLPVDLWIPSSSTILPERSDQFSMAFSKQIETINLSVEAYYKKMDNLIYYKPGYSVFNTLNWEDAIEMQGHGFSKGIEILVQKNKGKSTGWLGYTLSKDTRRFKNINSGSLFPFKYGRLHEINLVYALEISQKVSFSANWVFASGNYVTLATQKFPAIENTFNGDNYFNLSFPEAHYYGSVNNFQTAPYHRLDVGFNFKKQLKKSERNIYVGVYNLYNRQNPYYYYFKNTIKGQKLYQYSLFPVIPSVGFKYVF